MPRLIKSCPKYCRHRASGQAVVTICGRDIYLGPYGTKASKSEYDRLIGEWLASGRPADAPSSAPSLTVTELIARFWGHAKTYYQRPDGSVTSEVANIRLAMKPVRALYGARPAAEFGPLALKAVRQSMIDSGWCRGTVNRMTGRVRRLFRWGVENELVPPSVHHGLQAVAGLRSGRSDAKDHEPVKPVPIAYVDAVLPFVSPIVAAAIRVQLLTGARSGEILRMRASDIDMTGAVWVYRPAAHKNQFRGHQREVYLGPLAQEIVKSLLTLDTTAYLFAPSESQRIQSARRRAERKSPMTPSQAKRRPKKRPKRTPGDKYAVTAYARACVRADAPHWHPHQIRHATATELRKQYGLETAKIILGHKSMGVTEVYAEADRAKALQVMSLVG